MYVRDSAAICVWFEEVFETIGGIVGAPHSVRRKTTRSDVLDVLNFLPKKRS